MSKNDKKKDEEITKDSVEAPEVVEAPVELTLEEKLAEANDKFLRLAAEYDNFRKRSIKEREGAMRDGVVRTVSSLLGVYDNLERALAQETADEAYKKGVELIMKQFSEGFEKLRVSQITTEVGTAFDPNLHHAVMHVEDESLGENVIAEVFAKGFQIDDKVIRHSMVKTAN